ncbi:MAG: helix-turn-helix domain-containing protein [Cellvibrionaceae bacterium]
MNMAIADSFQSLCREWRRFRQLSQLDLALAAEVSQRHVSWLETGRSHPSRDMVIRLSEAMNIPIRERNVLLQSAGFSAIYSESSLNDPIMAPVMNALNHVLKNHEPLPAVVVDRFWNVKKQNQAAQLLLSLGATDQLQAQITNPQGEINLALLTLHPNGLRQYISNWKQAAPAFIQRLKDEAIASGDPSVKETFGEYITMAGDLGLEASKTPTPQGQLLPILPLELDIDGLKLSLFSVISTFGTPQDITTDELRIEAFYPTDDATQAFFESMEESS